MIRPRYIDDDPVGEYSTTARSWAMNSMVRPSGCCSVAQQVDDLRLDRDVERRDRLVGDDEAGPDRERPGDADALALAAGELVRIAAHQLGGEADQGHQLRDPGGARGAAACEPVHDQRLGDDVLAAHARIKRGEGVLEDRLGLAAEPTQPSLRQAGDVAALEQDLAFAGIRQAEDAATHRGLAGAGFPHQAHGLAVADGEGHVLDRTDMQTGAAERALAGVEPFAQPAHLEQRRRGGGDRHGTALAAARSAGTSRQRRQRSRWSGAAASSGGTSLSQRPGRAWAQRGWKAQPGGGCSGLGTLPGIAWRSAAPGSMPRRGTDSSRPIV
jgi:hypothetical protein